MNIANPQHTKTIWSSLFRRRGGSSEQTKLFDDFDAAVQRAIVEYTALSENELPVIGSQPKQQGWFLLTTKRLLLFSTGQSQTVETSDIIEVVPIEFAKTKKTEMSFLGVKTRDSNELQLHVEPGPPFFGVWNILRNIVSQNKSFDKLLE